RASVVQGEPSATGFPPSPKSAATPPARRAGVPPARRLAKENESDASPEQADEARASAPRAERSIAPRRQACEGSREREAGAPRVRFGAVERRAAPRRRVVARRQLPLGGADLPVRQPAAAEAARQGAHQAAPPRALGDDARLELRLRAPEPSHPARRFERDLR